ncbi:MAG: serine/threonine-protein kinase, partial [Kiritimatiellia bacterium]
MLMTFQCPYCQAELEGDAATTGSKVTCPACNAEIKVPGAGLGPGTTLGGYRIESKLGVGGMGEVYLATQLSMDRKVALKVLPPHMNRSKATAERFLNELKMLGRLEHPHIVTAFDAGADSGVLFFAMAFVDGPSVTAHLEKHGVYGERAALQITRKLAGALAYAWERHQLLHRDIKPSNILIDPNGEPRLVDFGLAKSLGANTGLTMTNAIMGTPNYMSPEQVEGGVLMDARADMYSLGATLYHMLTGNLPFSGSSLVEVLRKQISESLPDPRAFNPRLSEVLTELLEIMLAKDRDARHENWAALIADVDRVLAGDKPTRAAPGLGASTLIRARDMVELEEIRKRRPARMQPSHRAVPHVVLRTAPTPLSATGRPWLKPAGIAAGVMLVAIGVVLALWLRPRDADALAAPPEAAAPAEPVPVTAEVIPEEDPALAAADLQDMDEQHQQAAAAAWAALKAQTDALAAEGKYADALALLAANKGSGAADRAEMREARITEIMRQRDEQAAARAAEADRQRAAADGQAQDQAAAQARAAMADVLNTAAGALLAGRVPDALAALESGLRQPALASVKPEVERALTEVRTITEEPRRILASFDAQRGREVHVEFDGNRKETLQITGVAGGQVQATRQVAAGILGRDFGIADLSPAERRKRGGERTAIGRAVIAIQAGNADAAQAALADDDGPLARALGERLDALRAEQAARLAERDFARLLAMLGHRGRVADPTALAQAITERAADASADVKDRLARAAVEYRATHGTSAVAVSNDVILIALECLAPEVVESAAPSPASSAPTQSVTAPAPPASAQKRSSDPLAIKAERDAQMALAELLKLAGFGTQWDNQNMLLPRIAAAGDNWFPVIATASPNEMIPKIAAKSFVPAEVKAITNAVAALEREFGQTELVQTHWRLIDVLAQAGPQPRPLYVRATTGNIKRAMAAAHRENQDDTRFDLKVEPADANTVRVELLASSAPVRLESLRWLPVEELNLAIGMELADYGVLQTWPLKSFRAYSITVDIAWLEGLPIEELGVISCFIRNVDALSEFTGMRGLGFT